MNLPDASHAAMRERQMVGEEMEPEERCMTPCVQTAVLLLKFLSFREMTDQSIAAIAIKIEDSSENIIKHN